MANVTFNELTNSSTNPEDFCDHLWLYQEEFQNYLENHLHDTVPDIYKKACTLKENSKAMTFVPASMKSW